MLPASLTQPSRLDLYNHLYIKECGISEPIIPLAVMKEDIYLRV